MKLLATINGQPAEIEIADDQLNRGALKHREAMKYLGVKTTKFYELLGLGRFNQTSYGTIPIAELNDHLKREVERKQNRTRKAIV